MYIYDGTILGNLSKHYKNIPVKPFNDSMLEALLLDPSAEDMEMSEYLLEQATEALKVWDCCVGLKKFSSDTLSALFLPGDGSLLDALTPDFAPEEDFPSFLDDLSGYVDLRKPSLYLNISNSLVQKLMHSRDMDSLKAAVLVLYVQALLAGHYPVGQRELDALSDGLSALIE